MNDHLVVQDAYAFGRSHGIEDWLYDCTIQGEDLKAYTYWLIAQCVLRRHQTEQFLKGYAQCRSNA